MSAPTGGGRRGLRTSRGGSGGDDEVAASPVVPVQPEDDLPGVPPVAALGPETEPWRSRGVGEHRSCLGLGDLDEAAEVPDVPEAGEEDLGEPEQTGRAGLDIGTCLLLLHESVIGLDRDKPSVRSPDGQSAGPGRAGTGRVRHVPRMSEALNPAAGRAKRGDNGGGGASPLVSSA